MDTKHSESLNNRNEIIGKDKYIPKNLGYFLMILGFLLLGSTFAFDLYMTERFHNYSHSQGLLKYIGGILLLCMGIFSLKIPMIKLTDDHMLYAIGSRKFNYSGLIIHTRNGKPIQILKADLDEAIKTGKASKTRIFKIPLLFYPEADRNYLFNILKKKGVQIITK